MKTRPLRPCTDCGQPTETLHEVFPGTGRRRTCIKHGIQVPLCPVCHAEAHKNTRRSAERYCDTAGLNYLAVRQAFDHRNEFVLSSAGGMFKTRWQSE